MSCGYCYADRGKFGGSARLMPFDVAVASVDRLIAQSAPGADLVLGFIGGEPLINRKLVHSITAYAAEAAHRAGRRMRFSLTTNATLVEPEDARLFQRSWLSRRRQPRWRQDRQRPGAAQCTTAAVRTSVSSRVSRCCNRTAGRGHLSARATVTPANGRTAAHSRSSRRARLRLRGFAAVLTSPDPGAGVFRGRFRRLPRGMIDCGRKALQALVDRRPYPFSNFETALHEIHRGTHRPYPCGAGAGYLSVNAKGNLYACHRLLDDERLADGRRLLRHRRRPSRAAPGQRPCRPDGTLPRAAGRAICAAAAAITRSRGAAGSVATISAAGSNSAWPPMPSCRWRGPIISTPRGVMSRRSKSIPKAGSMGGV